MISNLTKVTQLLSAWEGIQANTAWPRRAFEVMGPLEVSCLSSVRKPTKGKRLELRSPYIRAVHVNCALISKSSVTTYKHTHTHTHGHTGLQVFPRWSFLLLFSLPSSLLHIFCDNFRHRCRSAIWTRSALDHLGLCFSAEVPWG